MKCKAHLGGVLTTLLLASPAAVHATGDPGVPIHLFAESCLTLLDDASGFAEAMDRVGHRLDGKLAQDMLGGLAGKAWLVNHDDVPYGFSLTDQGMCRTVIIQGDAPGIAAEFALLGRSVPTGYTMREEPPSTEDDGQLTHAYTWHKPGSDDAVHLRLSLNMAPAAHVRGIVLVGYVPAEP